MNDFSQSAELCDFEQLPILPTKYGLMRQYPREHFTSKSSDYIYTLQNDTRDDARGHELFHYLVALPSDGGLTLPDGRTYVSAPGKFIIWNVYGDFRMPRPAGGSFPIKAVKANSKKLERYSDPYSVEAQEFANVILEHYLNGDLGVVTEPVDLVMRSHNLEAQYRIQLRTMKEMEEENETLREKIHSLNEDYSEAHPDEAWPRIQYHRKMEMKF